MQRVRQEKRYTQMPLMPVSVRLPPAAGKLSLTHRPCSDTVLTSILCDLITRGQLSSEFPQDALRVNLRSYHSDHIQRLTWKHMAKGLPSLMPSVGTRLQQQLSDAVLGISFLPKLAANVSAMRSNCSISPDSFKNRTFLRVEEKLNNLFQNNCSKSLIFLLDLK